MDVILATTSSFGTQNNEIIDEINKKGLKLVRNPYKRKLTENELIKLLIEFKPIGILAGTEPITEKALKLAARNYLKTISRVGVGWDNVDKECATKLGINVTRTEGVLTDAVSELTIGLILSACRNIAAQDRHVRNNRWQKKMGSLLRGKTLGIIGFGEIGKRVAQIASAIGTTILFYDPIDKHEQWASQVSLTELFSKADIISIHASGSDCIIGKKEIEQLKEGVIIINTARGGLIDEAQLYQCLKQGRIGYACLDVFDEEPYAGPLTGLDNVILTPHIGSYAIEARVEMENRAVKNLLENL